MKMSTIKPIERRCFNCGAKVGERCRMKGRYGYIHLIGYHKERAFFYDKRVKKLIR